MTITSTMRALALLFSLGVCVTSVSAHNGVVHEETEDSQEIETMEKTIALLTQVVALLKQKAALTHTDGHHNEVVEDSHGDASGVLLVWVELHSNKTHAHVQQSGKVEESFLLADIVYTDEDAVIDAIAEKTGLSKHAIEEVIEFPSGEVDEHGDSVEEHDHDADTDTSGIHIMSDGKIMWGNGGEVAGATITVDGNVKLADGTVITPAFDLR